MRMSRARIIIAALLVILTGCSSSSKNSSEEAALTSITLQIEGEDYVIPCTTITKNGVSKGSESIYDMDYGFIAWSRPFANPATITKPEDNIGSLRCFIYRNVAYVVFCYFGIVDTWVYDIENESGYWMSGAESLASFYHNELKEIRKLEQQENVDTNFNCFRNYDVVTISYDYNYALIRQYKRPGNCEGKYLLRNLETNEESFVCESYPRSTSWMSGIEEKFEWTDSNTLKIFILGDEFSSCIISFNEDGWTATREDDWESTLDMNQYDNFTYE